MHRSPIVVAVFEPDDDVERQIRQALTSRSPAAIERIRTTDEIPSLIARSEVDIFVVDLNAPGGVGLAFVQAALDAAERIPGRVVPVLGLVGHMDQRAANLISELGSRLFLTRKPFETEMFLADLSQALGEEVGPNSGYGMTDDAAVRGFLRTVQDAIARGAVLESACDVVRKRLEVQPKSPLLWTYHGGLRLDHGDVDDAEQSAARAMEINPLFLPAMNLRARIAVRLSRYEDAIRWMERASQVSPMNVARLNALGELHLSAGRHSAAEEKFRRALKYHPGSFEAKIGLAKTLIERGMEEGNQVAASISDPTILASQVNLRAVILSRAGFPDVAAKLYEKAITYLPKASGKESALRYNLALAHLRCGRPGQALKEIQRCLLIKPDFEKARRCLNLARDAVAGRSIVVPSAVAGSINGSVGIDEKTISFLRGDSHPSIHANDEDAADSDVSTLSLSDDVSKPAVRLGAPVISYSDNGRQRKRQLCATSGQRKPLGGRRI